MADPERHLAALSAIEYVAFNSRRRLLRGRDPVYRTFHEFREVFHPGEGTTV